MNKLEIQLENCYGIKKLKHEFDFSQFSTVVIYASNGVMKTSFAKTLKDISNKKKPFDQADESLASIYNFLTDSSGTQISPEEICVIEPYNERAFNSEDKILTLLANEETRRDYLAIYKEIESAKKTALGSLKKISGSGNYEAEIIESFSHLGVENIFEIFDEVLNDIKKSKDVFNFTYNHVFDQKGKVKDFLDQNLSLLEQYIAKYNELISQSSFFDIDKEHVFGTSEAKSLGESLSGDGYFFAGHKLVLKSHGDILDAGKLSEIADEEIAKIFNDGELKKIFEKIDSALNANKELREFKKVIEKDKSILLRLNDYNEFRCAVWLSFLKQIEIGLEDLVDLYKGKKEGLEEIIRRAKDGQSAWEDAILEFENRFVNMPFKIKIRNKADAVLNAQTPAIDFTFLGKDIERDNLIENILSQGEKRAFYLLNIIFEIKSRKLQGQKTLFVIDDIADSFDYKNKYAIVEYLNDLSKEQNFYIIIMTHNFDFFRTLQSRILTESFKRTHSFIAEKFPDEIRFIEAGSRNITDPFMDWKAGINSNEKHLIACIPFVRNLIDFKEGKNSDYHLLTHILHSKEEDKAKSIKATADICIGDLEPVFKGVLPGIAFEYPDKNKKVIDIIDILIAAIKAQSNKDSLVLEDKIILAIGIRLKAELYMWSKVPDKSSISGGQTGKLFQRYKDKFSQDSNHHEAIKILESVNIMTPESIHLNSFMYEPILDMGIVELEGLYDKVCNI